MRCNTLRSRDRAEAIKRIWNRLKCSSVALQEAKQNGRALQVASIALKDEREVVLQAIKQNSRRNMGRPHCKTPRSHAWGHETK